MISVLVTGANSATGRMVIQSLVADTRVGHVLAVGKGESQLDPSSRLTALSVDLTHTRTVRELLFGPARDLGVEVVVHLGTDGDARARGRQAHKGVEALRSILDLADRHPTIRRVVVRSFAVVYKVAMDLPILVTEDHPLNLSASAPQYVRDRVEADLTACTRMGLANAEIVVLRCAEALAPNAGSQLFDYLSGPIAFRPAGFDPMVNVATMADIVAAVEAATHGSGEGVFNIPGFDTLPLTACAHKFGTTLLPMPGPLVQPLYNLRHRVLGTSFSYGLNRHRMHFGLVLDGTRARLELGYTPTNAVHWIRGRSARPSDAQGVR